MQGMSRLIRILSKSGIVFTNPFHPARAYQRPRRGDARNDFSRIVGDMRYVGADMRRVADQELSKYVGQ